MPPRKHKPKRKRASPGKGEVEEPTQDPTAALSLRKNVLFGLGTTVLFFVLVELVLALVRVRPTIWTEDPFVGFESYLEVFQLDESTGEMETAPNKLDFLNHQRFPSKKPPNTFRVFTLGGSTTYGRPFEDETSFAGWLRAYLRAVAPDRNWEVINCGAISYASYRVAKVMEELRDYEPDLFIIYSGNNEFLERRTYHDIIEEPAAVRVLKRVLSHSRLYALAEKIKRRGETRAREKYELTGEVEEILNLSTGLDAYYRDDRLEEQVLSHYRFNLGRMVKMAHADGTRVILVTIPVNEKDFAPFKSQPREGLGEEDRQRFQARLEQGRDALDRGEPEDATRLLLEAIDIDPRYAEAQFLLGKSLLALGSHEEAQARFRAAIQEDVCPLRALAEFNEAIRQIGQREDVPVVDFQRTLKARMLEESGHQNLGKELFFDHVHPTVATHGLLVRALTSQMAEMGILELEPGWHDRLGKTVMAEVESRVDDHARAQAHKNLSKVLIWAGKKKETERYVRQAEEFLAEDWEVHYNAGVVSLQSEDHQRAIASFKEAIRLNPAAAQAHDYLGAVYIAVGELDQAIAHGEKAVQLEPSLTIAHSNLATAYTSKGELERAKAAALEALELDPEFAAAHNNLGNVYFAMGRPDAALGSYDRALQSQPNHAEAILNRGLVLGEMGRFQEAARSFSRALEFKGDWAAAHMGLGKAFFALGRPAKALSSFEKAVELGEESPEAYVWLARSLASEKRLAKAKEALNRGLRVSPRHPSLHQLYGQILASEDEYDDAIGHLELALAASAEFPGVAVAEDQLHHGLAMALLGSNRVEEGLTHLKRAVATNPDNALAVNDLGLVYEHLGQLEEALRHYQRAVDLDAGFALAVENLRRLKQRMASR